LAGFNGLFFLFFRAFPVLGIMSYVMIPYLLPEICLTEYNMERWVPIHVMWGGIGVQAFFENLTALIARFAFWLQPTMGCIFIWSVALHMKDERLKENARGMTQLGLGTFFIFFLFQMLSLCGGSYVLVWILRAVYGVWFGFALLFIISYIMLIWKARGVIWEKLHPKNELLED
jgi:hypothetical protein